MNILWPTRHERPFSGEFCQRTLDALLSHIAILTEDGTVVAVNAAWNHFAKSNALDYRLWDPVRITFKSAALQPASAPRKRRPWRKGLRM